MSSREKQFFNCSSDATLNQTTNSIDPLMDRVASAYDLHLADPNNLFNEMDFGSLIGANTPFASPSRQASINVQNTTFISPANGVNFTKGISDSNLPDFTFVSPPAHGSCFSLQSTIDSNLGSGNSAFASPVRSSNFTSSFLADSNPNVLYAARYDPHMNAEFGINSSWRGNFLAGPCPNFSSGIGNAGYNGIAISGAHGVAIGGANTPLPMQGRIMPTTNVDRHPLPPMNGLPAFRSLLMNDNCLDDFTRPPSGNHYPYEGIRQSVLIDRYDGMQSRINEASCRPNGNGIMSRVATTGTVSSNQVCQTMPDVRINARNLANCCTPSAGISQSLSPSQLSVQGGVFPTSHNQQRATVCANTQVQMESHANIWHQVSPTGSSCSGGSTHDPPVGFNRQQMQFQASGISFDGYRMPSKFAESPIHFGRAPQMPSQGCDYSQRLPPAYASNCVAAPCRQQLGAFPSSQGLNAQNRNGVTRSNSGFTVPPLSSGFDPFPHPSGFETGTCMYVLPSHAKLSPANQRMTQNSSTNSSSLVSGVTVNESSSYGVLSTGYSGVGIPAHGLQDGCSMISLHGEAKTNTNQQATMEPFLTTQFDVSQLDLRHHGNATSSMQAPPIFSAQYPQIQFLESQGQSVDGSVINQDQIDSSVSVGSNGQNDGGPKKGARSALTKCAMPVVRVRKNTKNKLGQNDSGPNNGSENDGVVLQIEASKGPVGRKKAARKARAPEIPKEPFGSLEILSPCSKSVLKSSDSPTEMTELRSPSFAWGKRFDFLESCRVNKGALGERRDQMKQCNNGTCLDVARLPDTQRVLPSVDRALSRTLCQKVKSSIDANASCDENQSKHSSKSSDNPDGNETTVRITDDQLSVVSDCCESLSRNSSVPTPTIASKKIPVRWETLSNRSTAAGRGRGNARRPSAGSRINPRGDARTNQRDDARTNQRADARTNQKGDEMSEEDRVMVKNIVESALLANGFSIKDTRRMQEIEKDANDDLKSRVSVASGVGVSDCTDASVRCGVSPAAAAVQSGPRTFSQRIPRRGPSRPSLARFIQNTGSRHVAPRALCGDGSQGSAWRAVRSPGCASRPGMQLNPSWPFRPRMPALENSSELFRNELQWSIQSQSCAPLSPQQRNLCQTINSVNSQTNVASQGNLSSRSLLNFNNSTRFSRNYVRFSGLRGSVQANQVMGHAAAICESNRPRFQTPQQSGGARNFAFPPAWQGDRMAKLRSSVPTGVVAPMQGGAANRHTVEESSATGSQNSVQLSAQLPAELELKRATTNKSNENLASCVEHSGKSKNEIGDSSEGGDGSDSDEVEADNERCDAESSSDEDLREGFFQTRSNGRVTDNVGWHEEMSSSCSVNAAAFVNDGRRIAKKHNKGAKISRRGRGVSAFNDGKESRISCDDKFTAIKNTNGIMKSKNGDETLASTHNKTATTSHSGDGTAEAKNGFVARDVASSKHADLALNNALLQYRNDPKTNSISISMRKWKKSRDPRPSSRSMALDGLESDTMCTLNNDVVDLDEKMNGTNFISTSRNGKASSSVIHNRDKCVYEAEPGNYACAALNQSKTGPHDEEAHLYPVKAAIQRSAKRLYRRKVVSKSGKIAFPSGVNRLSDSLARLSDEELFNAEAISSFSSSQFMQELTNVTRVIGYIGELDRNERDMGETPQVVVQLGKRDHSTDHDAMDGEPNCKIWPGNRAEDECCEQSIRRMSFLTKHSRSKHQHATKAFVSICEEILARNFSIDADIAHRRESASTVLAHKPLNRVAPGSSAQGCTGALLVQECACTDLPAHAARCRECSAAEGSATKLSAHIVSNCRFYAFRRLRVGARGLEARGFAGSSEADADHIRLWLSSAPIADPPMSVDTATYIVANVGANFCELVEQERDALAWDASGGCAVWKRAVHGVREMCDSCETTIFNTHWACDRCGFVVCLDCYRRHLSCATKCADNARTCACAKWLTCTGGRAGGGGGGEGGVERAEEREEHKPDRLLLTQIIPFDALFVLGRRLHEVCRKWKLEIHCACNSLPVALGATTSESPAQLQASITCKSTSSRAVVSSKKKSKSSGCQKSEDKERWNNCRRLEDVGYMEEFIGKVLTLNFKPRTLVDVLTSVTMPKVGVGYSLEAEKTAAKANGSILLQEASKSSGDSIAGGNSVAPEDVADCRNSTVTGNLAMSRNFCADLVIKSQAPLVDSGDQRPPEISRHSDADVDSSLTSDLDINSRNLTLPPLLEKQSLPKFALALNHHSHDSPAYDLPNPDQSGPDLPASNLPGSDLHAPSLPAPHLPIHNFPAPNLPATHHQGPDLPAPSLRSYLTPALFPDAPHAWLDNGRLLQLLDPSCAYNVRLFRAQWRHARPVLVSNCQHALDPALWTPESFRAEFGEQINDLVDCGRKAVVAGYPMKAFWDGFESVGARLRDDRGQPMVLKLKDWPPTEDFCDALPDRFNNLLQALPLPDYTRRDGCFNLVSRLPSYFVRPDLGPKMYNAYGSAMCPRVGSTNLHLDVSDAVNMIMYVGVPADDAATHEEACPMVLAVAALKAMEEAGCCAATRARVFERGEKIGALWHIFDPQDAVKIRAMLHKVGEEIGEHAEQDADPIHDQSWYLDEGLRARLLAQHGVQGYTLVQCVGDAIFIPAGAPHQVRNLHSCIKAAEDFVSPENLTNCFRMMQEFRHLSDTHTNHEDKLQVKNVIYHAVKDAVAILQSSEPSHSS